METISIFNIYCNLLAVSDIVIRIAIGLNIYSNYWVAISLWLTMVNMVKLLTIDYIVSNIVT